MLSRSNCEICVFTFTIRKYHVLSNLRSHSFFHVGENKLKSQDPLILKLCFQDAILRKYLEVQIESYED